MATSPSLFWRYRRLFFLAGLLVVTAAGGAAYLLVRVPLPPERQQAQTTFLTDATGARLATLSNGVNRVFVPIDKVPAVVTDAVLATEDRSFFDHGGVDPVGILRATFADVRGKGSLQGGSTITQQYVKNVYLGRERTLSRKLKEAALAVKLERKLSKQQILERYLNTVYFGRGAYGVQAAAQAYFGKDVGQLGLPEASYLAGLIRSPVGADALQQPERANERRDRTLRAMVKAHRIDGPARDQVLAVPVESYVVARGEAQPTFAMAEKGTQYFADFVRRQLLSRYPEATVYGGGLRVKTTLDLRMQSEAYDAVYGFLNRPDDPAGALVSMDGNGEVKAMVGGRNYDESQVNLAVGAAGGGSGRQPGSTFKPFVLAELVRQGYSVQSALPAPPSVVFPRGNKGRDYEIDNFEGETFDQPISVIEATKLSVNTVYAQLIKRVGPAKVVEMAHKAGVTAELSPDISLTLGTSEVSVLDMADAFSTFARRGEQVAPVTILEVRTADGHVLERAKSERVRAMTAKVADTVNYCLQQVVTGGTGTGASIGKPVAGKTGTTQEYGDAWFVGYTPRLTTAVWMGFPEGNSKRMTSVRGRKVNGGSFPATIFKRFMTAAVRLGDYGGSFAPAPSLGGKPIPVDELLVPTTTTSSSSTVPPPTTAPAPSTTSTTAKKPDKTTTTTRPPTTTTSSSTTSTTRKP
jgi:penicillin-binding protein 1A